LFVLSSFSLWEKVRMRGDIKFSFLILVPSLTLTLSQRERETILLFPVPVENGLGFKI
jgi:hypothetical protein